MNDYSGYLGYLKIRGPGIEDGVLGARQSAEALWSFDSALRYFLLQKRPELAKAQFELPVKVRKGSWEALIPTTVADWIISGTGIAATSYVTTAATQLAKNGFKNKGLTQAVKDGFKLLMGVVRIAKHVGGMAKKSIGVGVKFEENNRIITIPNDDGVYLRTTREELEAYMRAPKKMLEDVARILEQDREFSFGEVKDDGTIIEEVVTYADRNVFVEEEEVESEDILFPELTHDKYVTLQGSMTRGNRLTNTIGFQYNDHILTCVPAGVSITAFRDSFFKDCTIKGRVSRLTDTGEISAKRPKIIFSELIPNEPENPQASLL